MKVKKAVKRLTKVGLLLSKVRRQLPRSKDGLGEILDSAKKAVDRAMQAVNSQLSSSAAKNGVAKKPPAKAGTARQGRLTEEGRKRISRAAKRRWAMAKRKGVSAATGRPLSKTA
jgi:hypothetical protein